MFSLIKLSYLVGRMQMDRVGSATSEKLTNLYDMPQEIILGPVFFYIYFNGLF